MKLFVKLEKNPQVNFVNQITEYLNPTNIYIPILDRTVFKMHDYVYKNTFFGNFIASTSGTISGSKKIFYEQKHLPALKVTNDLKENVKVKKRKRKITNRSELLNVLKDYSLEEIIAKIESVQRIDKLIITSIDEEVYSLKEYMILVNYYNEILETIELLLKILGLKESLIVAKNTDFLSIKNVKSIIGTYPFIKIDLLPDKYLISHKEFLCDYLNIKKDNSLILTVSDIYDLYYCLIKSRYITETLLTLSGDNLEKSLVVKTKLGVSLKELLKKIVTLKDPEYDVYVNGYLQGFKVENINEIIITKDIHTVVINKRVREEETACINCGACNKICPVSINVKYCYFNNKTSNRCLGCGLCSYICPAKLKLKEKIKSEENES